MSGQLRELLRQLGGQTRRLWKPIISEMGPLQYSVMHGTRGQMRAAMTRHGIAEFLAGDSFVLGRLTWLGVELRDHWIRADAVALNMQLRKPAES
jgi:hypothetical protein